MKKSECSNCGRKFDSPYCPRCGQRRGSGRLTWNSLWDGTMSTFVGEGFGGEKGNVIRYGVLQTLWHICYHPVRTTAAYLSGKTRTYFNPIALLLLLSTACALAANTFHLDLALFSVSSKEGSAGFVQWLVSRMNANPALSLMLIAPITALNYKWIFRKVSSFCYVEYFYVEIIVGCISMTISLFQVGLYAAAGIQAESTADSILNGVSYAVIFAVSVCIYHSLLRIGWRRALLGTFLATLCSYAMAFIATILLTIAYIITTLHP